MEFLDRERLSREAALAHEEVFRRQQPHVAWNHIAGGQLDDVPGHQVPEWDLPRRAVPNDRSACKEGNRRQSRQQDHQRVADDFQKAEGPALLPLLCDLIRTRRARPFFGISLR